MTARRPVKRPRARSAPRESFRRGGPAAQQFFADPTLLERTLKFLQPHQLARFMRVEKRVAPMVAKFLYHTVKFARVKNHMSRQTASYWSEIGGVKLTLSQARQRLYCAAVRVIDARDLKLSPAMQRELGINDTTRKSASRVARLETHYSLDVFQLVVPSLRTKCPNLTKILFGSRGSYQPYGPAKWSVTFKEDGAFFDITRTITASLSSDPSGPLQPIQIPPGYQSGIDRFDFKLSTYSDHSRAARWLQALRTRPVFANLYRSINLGDLEVSLSDMTTLYRRQIAAAHTERLARVEAVYVAPWSTADFRAFAHVASKSLTSLILAEGYSARRAKLSFASLPALIDIVWERLPNLKELTFALRDVENCEADCQRMLSRHTLLVGGSVRTLRVFTEKWSKPLFNGIRILSQLCTAEADLQLVNVETGKYGWEAEREHSQFLRYMRRQSYERRVRLGTVDFSTLDIADLSDVTKLNYHPNGQPMKLWEGAATQWARDACQSRDSVVHNVIPSLQRSLHNYSTATNGVASTAQAEPNSVLMVRKLENLLANIKDVKAVVQRGEGFMAKVQASSRTLRNQILVLEAELAEEAGGE